MNNTRRQEINKMIETLRSLEAQAEDLRDAEQETFDNMPEGLQGSDNGQKCEAASSALDCAVSAISDALSQLEEAAQ